MQAHNNVLDPTSLDQAASVILSNILFQSPDVSLFNKAVIGELGVNQPTTYYFTHSLLKIKPHQYAVLDLIPEPFAEGNFSQIYNCHGIVKLGVDDDYGCRATYKQGNYIIKHQLIWIAKTPIPKKLPSEPVALTSHAGLKKELSHSMQAGIHIKGCALTPHAKIKNIYNGFTVMDRYPGVDLFDFTETYLNEQFLDESDDTGKTDFIIRLVIELLRVLEKFHQKGLVHQDLKPENMMVHVDKSRDSIQLKVIDMGLSKQVTEETKGGVGTPEYAAPEVFEGKNTTIKTDIFSIGKIMGNLFGVHRSIVNLKVAYHYSLYDELESIFLNTPDLACEHQNKIYTLLKQMIARKPQARPGYPEILPIFEEILLERKLERVKSDEEYCAQIREANEAAQTLRLILSALEQKAKKQSLAYFIHEFQGNIAAVLSKIKDKPLVVQQFVDKLGSKFLEKLWAVSPGKSKAGLQKGIDDFLFSIITKIATLKKVSIAEIRKQAYALKSNELEKLVIKYERTLSKFKEVERTVDGLESVDKLLSRACAIYTCFQGKAKKYASHEARPSTLGLFANPVTPALNIQTSQEVNQQHDINHDHCII